MAKTALITGITGQDGAYLARLLLDKGYTVWGGVRLLPVKNPWRLHEMGVFDHVQLVPFDLRDDRQIAHLIETVAPDEIYNLAAESFVARSFDEPVETGDVDALGVARILGVLHRLKATSRFYQASTSEMFGKVREVPQRETTPFHPRSPYGVAKLYAHWLTVNYRESYGLHASNGILFNHESPLRGAQFVTRKITLALARIRAGEQDMLMLGNLAVSRDWGYAGDYVEGMWRMLQRDEPGDYVLATGRTQSLKSFVEAAGVALGFDLVWQGAGVEQRGIDRRSGRALIGIDPAFYRPADIDLVMGDPSRAESQLGWQRRVEFPALVALMAEADARRVRDGTLRD